MEKGGTIMKFKKGDLVKTRPDLKAGGTYGGIHVNSAGRMQYGDKILKVHSTSGTNCLELELDGKVLGWVFSDEMLIPAEILGDEIDIETLKARGLVNGDMIYLEHEDKGFTGWYLVRGKYVHGLTSIGKGANGSVANVFENDCYSVTRIIPVEREFYFESHCTKLLRNWDESELLIPAVKIVEQKEVVMVEHKKGGKTYYFKPEGKLLVGDFVVCDTTAGKTYGRVTGFTKVSTAEYNKHAACREA